MKVLARFCGDALATTPKIAPDPRILITVLEIPGAIEICSRIKSASVRLSVSPIESTKLLKSVIRSAAAGSETEESLRRTKVSEPKPPVSVSLPASPTKTSLPAPPLSTSSPLPPCKVSLPESPNRMSLPAPPLSKSLPTPPNSVSELPPPRMRSLPSSPLMRSASEEPRIKSLPPRPKSPLG